MAEAHARDPDQRERTLLGRLGGTLPQLDALLRAEGFAVGPDRVNPNIHVMEGNSVRAQFQSPSGCSGPDGRCRTG